MAICEVNRFSLPFAAILKENRWLKRMAVYKTGFVWALFGLCLGFVWVLLGMGQPAGAGCTFYFRFTRYQFLYAHCRSQVSKQSWRRFLRNHVQRKKSYLKEKIKK